MFWSLSFGQLFMQTEIRTDSVEMAESLDALATFYTHKVGFHRWVVLFIDYCNRVYFLASHNHRGTRWKVVGSYGQIWKAKDCGSQKSSLRNSLLLKLYDRFSIAFRAQIPRYSSSRCPQRFHELDSSIQALRDGCGEVRRRLESTEARTAQFVARAEELRQQRGKVETRAVAASSFLSAYQLTPAELSALFTTPLEADEGKAFFAALRRIDDIRRECKGLISSALQSLGIEILEDMAKHQVNFPSFYPKIVASC